MNEVGTFALGVLLGAALTILSISVGFGIHHKAVADHTKGYKGF